MGQLRVFLTSSFPTDATVPGSVIEQFHLLLLAHLTRGTAKRSIMFKNQVLFCLQPE